MFLSRNKKNNVYPCTPQFYYIKVGFKGVRLYRRVFVMSPLSGLDMRCFCPKLPLLYHVHCAYACAFIIHKFHIIFKKVHLSMNNIFNGHLCMNNIWSRAS